jgi:hypothetical protein
MTLSRRAQTTLGAGSAVLLAGILGLAWWSWRQRRGREPVAPFRRVRTALVAAGVVILAVVPLTPVIKHVSRSLAGVAQMVG